MEDDQTQENQPDTSTKTIPLPPVAKVKAIPYPQKQYSYSYDTQKTQAIEPKIFVVIPSDKLKENEFMPLTADRIASVELLLNFVIFYFTYHLFMQTKRATQTAHDALDHQKEQDRKNEIERGNQSRIEAERRMEERRIHDEEINRERERFELEKRNTEAQIAAFRRQEEVYEAQNLSLVEIMPNIELFETGELVTYFIRIYNLGVQPLRVESAYIDCILLDKKYLHENADNFTLIYEKTEHQLALSKKHLVKGQPLKLNMNSAFTITTKGLNNVTKRETVLCVLGRIKYRNLATNRRYVYDFITESICPNQDNINKTVWNYNFVYNENYLDEEISN